jgi:hypothetical protein
VNAPVASPVTLTACSLVAHDAGAGGPGGAGATGETGGVGMYGGAGPDSPMPFEMSGCKGGDGGAGGKGAAGGGGAGGHSAAIAFLGKSVTVDSSTTMAFGALGAGGLDGTGARYGVGADGLAMAVLNVGETDTMAPTGGDVTAAAATDCGTVTLTLGQATDDFTDVGSIEYELCWSTTPTWCESNWTKMASVIGTTTATVNVADLEGQTVYFASRPRDLAGNLEDPTAATEMSATVPMSLQLSGTLGVSPVTATPFMYSLSWPTATTLCSTASVSSVVCVDGVCGASTTATTATVAGKCSSSIEVKVTDGITTIPLDKTATWPVTSSQIHTIFTGSGGEGCGSCHGSYPMFSSADDNYPVASPSPCSTGFSLVVPGSPSTSDLYNVASGGYHVCGTIHDGTGKKFTSSSDVDLLACWITLGAN